MTHEVKVIPRWDELDLYEEFNAIADEIDTLNRAKAGLDEQIKEKSTVLLALMESIKDDEGWSFRGDDYTATYVRPNPRSKLVVEKLYEQGVSEKVIKKATVMTPVSPYVSVRRKKEV